MRFEMDLPHVWIKEFCNKHDCTRNDIHHILAASLLKDKESQYYRNLEAPFDAQLYEDTFLLSMSISELATKRSVAFAKKKTFTKIQ